MAPPNNTTNMVHFIAGYGEHQRYEGRNVRLPKNAGKMGRNPLFF